MRDIERNIRNAITWGKSGALSVRDMVEANDSTTKYFLWGHNVYSEHYDIGEVAFSFCGYQTNTTKSRINALLPGGCSVYQKNWELFLNVDGVVYSFGCHDKVHINLRNHNVEIVKAA